ncbi:sigma-70 family RNA polymerase sigma factor [Gemmata sp. JC673]|uniref:Sigma-70 family RNA polymerase sigma factor n=1 Tax=Gemmata algarum TaxID=2975278 RepID=A0ABU5F0G7_9BACT|nr:sigma-70 family RNA polymerase sigma factor [Gemmata algarum]MDY3560250.1 sigma-70 family RNA polymerase sigma factor [Gemmata algarum]
MVRRHGAMVHCVCQQILRHDQDTEDAFQATFLILAEKLRSVRKRASLASWLHGVAHRVSLRIRDRNSARQRSEHGVATAEVRYPEDLDRGEACAILNTELSLLPDKWRLPLILCHLEGRTQDEAARQLGWSKGTLRNRLDDARTALGRRLRRRGIFGSGVLATALLSDCVAPALPPQLATSTVRAATRIAAGYSARGAAAPGALNLTEDMVKPMLLTKLNAATAGLFVLGLLVTGTSIAPHVSGAPRAEQPDKPLVQKPVPVSRTSAEHNTPSEPPTQKPVPTVLGPKAFWNGDVIEITDVRATSPKLEQGDSVTVRGRARLASRASAQLGLYLTQTQGNGLEEIDPFQTIDLKRGATEFELKTTIKHRGVLHLTVYDRSGKPFGGLYFGTSSQMKAIGDWSLDYYLIGESPKTP